MHIVMVLFKEQGSLQLLFEHLNHANKAYGAVLLAKSYADRGILLFEYPDKDWHMEKVAEIHDDYGSVATIDGEEVRAVVIQDLAQHLKGAAMHGLLQQRAQAELQKKAAADPTLRFLANSGLAAGMLNG